MELYALQGVSSPKNNLREMDIYSLEDVIHAGKSNIRILKAVVSRTQETVAIKLFPKQKDGTCLLNFNREENSASQLSHPHILQYYTFYRDAAIQISKDHFKEYSAIVMQYLPYGDLFDLVSKKSFSEKLCRTIFVQIISAVTHIHDQGLAHLDLKLENVLIDVKEGVKLIDFDSCEFALRSGLKRLSHKGSLGYRAPELAKGEIKNLLSADVYSLGVMLFTMVMGSPPYTECEKDDEPIFDKHYDALRNNTRSFWKVCESYRKADGRSKLSDEFKDVVEKMLDEDPSKRPRIYKLQEMPWFQGETYGQVDLEAKLKKLLRK